MKTLTTEELQQLKQSDDHFTLINTLGPEEYAKQHIPDSINIPVDLDDFVEHVEEWVADKSEPVVVYCANHDCSASETAAEMLEKDGFSNVYDYEDGIEAWVEAGNAVERGAIPVSP